MPRDVEPLISIKEACGIKGSWDHTLPLKREITKALANKIKRVTWDRIGLLKKPCAI